MDPREDYDDQLAHVPYWVPSLALWLVVAAVVLTASLCGFGAWALSLVRFGP
jgi:hypothetical protein